MFGFGKKKEETPVSYVTSKKSDDEIDLIPEDIPSELPDLELHPVSEKKIEPMLPAKVRSEWNSAVPKEMPLFPEVPQEQSMIVVPKRDVIKKLEPMQKFIDMRTYQNIAEEVNNVISDFDSMGMDIERAIEVKEMRNEKMDSLQSTLEDVSRKLMQVDATLFGG